MRQKAALLFPLARFSPPTAPANRVYFIQRIPQFPLDNSAIRLVNFSLVVLRLLAAAGFCRFFVF
jgi:hypothetical protein